MKQSTVLYFLARKLLKCHPPVLLQQTWRRCTRDWHEGSVLRRGEDKTNILLSNMVSNCDALDKKINKERR